MRKAAIAVPAAALLSVATLTSVSAGVPASAENQASVAPAARSAKARSREGLPVRAAQVRRYHLTRKELRQITLAKKWARTPKARSVVRCESNGDYRLIDTPYYGAWQFLTSTWLGAGGRRYARSAHLAPRFAQDHIAWKLWKRSGWGPWGCA